MGSLNRSMWLIPLILSLSLPICFGQVVRDPKEKEIKNLFFNPRVDSEEIRKVVVLSIRSQGEELQDAHRITDLLVTSLGKVRKYEILPARDLRGLVEKRSMDRTKIHHYTQALEVGKALDVDGVITGSLSEYGRVGQRARFGLNLRMIRIPEGDTVWSMSCSAQGNPKEMESIAKGGIESIIRTLVYRWKSDGATMAWGIKLSPLDALGRYRYITLRVPEYTETGLREYIVSRGTAESGPYTEIKRFRTKRRVSLSFKDRDVQTDSTYFYRYRVITKQGFISPFSGAANARTKPVPQAPTGLRASGVQARRVSLSWKPNPEKDINRYIIYRSDAAGKEYKKIEVQPGNKTDFIDTKLPDGKTYSYKIKAVDADGLESEFSETISAMTKAPPPSPKGIKAEGGKGRITISWEANPEAEITRYYIYRKKAFRFKRIGVTQTISYTDASLRNEKAYRYKVTAVDKDGLESPFSQEVSATTAP